MFNPQQQQQLLHLQQILQPQWPAQQHGTRVLQPLHQPQQLLNLQRANQSTLLNANPMLQQALILQRMQGNFRGFNIGLQQVFPQATQHSLLGPPPVGFSMKPLRFSFPFQQQNRMYEKDYQRIFDRKRELGQGSLPQAKGSEEREQEEHKGEDSQTLPESKDSSSSAKEREAGGESSADDGSEPALKRLKSSEKGGAESPEQKPTMVCPAEEGDLSAGNSGTEEHENGSHPEERRVSLESKISEVPSVGSSLKVTIQQSSESRAISTAALKPGHQSREMDVTSEATLHFGPTFYCYICKSNCSSQQSFQSHMATTEHQQRFLEIQHISNASLVTLLPTRKESLQTLIDPDGTKRFFPQRWCNTCQLHFSGDLIKHRRTQEHKLAKHLLRPFCTICSRHFKTPRKFVEHMKSPEHKQKAQEARLGEKEPGSPEDPDELITVDAVGCFEDDEEEEGNSEEEDAKSLFPDDTSVTQLVTGKEMPVQGCEGNEGYCSDTVYGLDFVVPVTGYLCRLCHKFYPRDSAARLAHCKSWMHFQNIQKHKAAKNQGKSSQLQSSSLPLTGASNPLPAIPSQSRKSPRADVKEVKSTDQLASEKVACLLELPITGTKPPVTNEDEISGVLVVEDDLENESTSACEDSSLQVSAPIKDITTNQNQIREQANTETEET
ncbi:cip1-interacting zinc finger protein [Microcaecilia unicolor]|uniref:Cip1-interacting zinc finger protein n=1 Tax=Microcaecilia unicolor TaxID=1415580 RepID=A0A6P7Y8H4_9AMPH|nr:cip1-interacting zinc finger protein [Microcaecilia unicolor]